MRWRTAALPGFLRSIGAPAAALGAIEGIADGAMSAAKVAGANLTLILLDMARARPVGDQLATETTADVRTIRSSSRCRPKAVKRSLSGV
jgi:hypothetical protein